MKVTVKRASDSRFRREQEVETMSDVLKIGREVAPNSVDQMSRSVIVSENLETGLVTITQYDDYVE